VVTGIGVGVSGRGGRLTGLLSGSVARVLVVEQGDRLGGFGLGHRRVWLASDRHHVTLPRLGQIKTHESTRKLARRIEAGTARILSATVRC
jgi:hypothetical protein